MRVFAIDIGTNSTLHLVAEVEGNTILTVEQGIVRNRLGADIQADGTIDSELMDFNRGVMQNLARHAKMLRCSSIMAMGTHALRQAKNTHDFIAMSESYGIPLRILSGAEEAAMAWRGVFGVSTMESKSADETNQMALLDIGGGSSELSLGTVEAPRWSQSIPRGAVSLSRDFFRSDPPSASDISKATGKVIAEYNHWQGKIAGNVKLIGIAGTIFSLASLIHDVGEYQAGAVEGKVISYRNVCQWRDDLLKMKLDERQALASMPPARAESIHAGALILAVVMDVLQVAELTTSERGLLHGLSLEMAK